MYQVFPHTADVGLRVHANSLSSLFEEAGVGLFSLIVTKIDAVRPHVRKEFTIRGNDIEYLLLDWLHELLFTFDTEHLLLVEFDVSVDAKGLAAIAMGERFNTERHQLAHEVKAITYHGLKVVQDSHQWTAEVIIDI